ncbi:MAG: Eco57I restriction-modification methylase domain-containing protein [Treponema sp.]|nr:Eco57I restriction-modification methylase domain-containing protein [Treponema sp.]
MQRNEATKLIQETFEASYDESRFRRFIKEIFYNTEERGSQCPIKEAYKDSIKSCKYLFKYVTPDQYKTEIAVLAVHVANKHKLEKARSEQRNFIASFMKTRSKEAVLVAFYTDDNKRTDWRFSFVRKETNFDFDTHKSITVISPAKRYSYLVGETETSHTAQFQLLPLLEKERNNPTLKDLENTFEVEKVSKDFFEKYKGLYLKLLETMEEIIAKDKQVSADFTNHNISAELFCKKLLGQIVFLYFIQKKGWLGVEKGQEWGSGDRRFLRTLFNEAHTKGKSYFNNYLEPLFYEALATERLHHYYDKLGCKIPFLNGGLFDPVNSYDWVETDIKIPNKLFSNEDKDGILDVFDVYNFTVKEDEPLEKEVAVDPEMLGKVFENLLEGHDRKSKGAFYTPREIVHYMCQESLTHYLHSKLNKSVALEDLSFFIRYGDTFSEIEDKVGEIKSYSSILSPSIKENAKEIDQALVEVKVCDPAIGSGAFPVGLMHEIVRARSTLLNAGFIKKDKHRTIYEYKRQAIQESLYGVDIEESAIEIAKLRLWLSLIVDEDDINNIKPLPNLDYKIVVGDSLISKFENDIVEIDWERKNQVGEDQRAKKHIEELQLNLKELVEKQKQYFETTGLTKKADLKKDICLLKIKILINQLSYNKFWYEQENPKYNGFTEPAQKDLIRDAEIDLRINAFKNSIQKLQNLENNPQKVLRFFDWKLDFPEIMNSALVQQNTESCGTSIGFDIVIGNPPYVRVQNLTHDEIDSLKKRWSTAWKRIDISTLFIECSHCIVKDSGITSFISSNQFITTEYGRLMRNYLIEHTSLFKCLDFGDLKVFENALTYVSIFFFSKPKRQTFLYSKINSLPFSKPTTYDIVEYAGLTDNTWSLGAKEVLSIIEKIKKQKYHLSSYAKCWAGAFTGLDDKLMFDIDDEISEIENDLLLPVIRAQGCERYCYAAPSKKIFYPYYDDGNETIIISLNEIQQKYPIAYQFIQNNAMLLKNRKDSRKTFAEKKNWYGLVRFGKLSRFRKPKIVSPGEVKHNKFSLDMTGSAFSCGRVFSITSENDNLDIKFLLGLLNSKLIEFYLHNVSSPKQGGYYSYSSTVIDEIPVPDLSVEQPSIIKIVDEILKNKQSDPTTDTSVLEAKIDRMIYELYGLSDEEIEIIEGRPITNGIHHGK